MEKATNITRQPFLISNDLCSRQERHIGKSTKKSNSVEQVRFTNPVGACDTCEWPETDIHIRKILETIDF